MSETHFAYKITHQPDGVDCSHQLISEDKMLDLLLSIQSELSQGIVWLFKQMDGEPQEALCIIDCEQQRIYYHYSGEVELLNDVICKLQGKEV